MILGKEINVLKKKTHVGLPSHLPDDALKCANLICFFFIIPCGIEQVSHLSQSQ